MSVLNSAELLIDIDPEGEAFKVTATFKLWADGDIDLQSIIREDTGTELFDTPEVDAEVLSQLRDLTIDQTDWIVS